jgi:hypothetical protein
MNTERNIEMNTEMNTEATPIETLFERAEEYSKTTIELLKLNAVEKTTDIVSSIAVALATMVAALLFTLMINIGIALWIGKLLGGAHYGFFIVAGFYGLAAVLVQLFQVPWIKIPISNSIISQMLKKNVI